MEITNLGKADGLPPVDWAAVVEKLDAGSAPAPDAVNSRTTWLSSINEDGSPHVTAVGALWLDGTFWFQTGAGTRKGRNVARDPRCSIAVSIRDKAVDTDDGWCEQLPGGRQRWREDAIARLLDTEDADVLFIAGCEENQVCFHSRFDLIILLSAPAPAMIKRSAPGPATLTARRPAIWTGSSATRPRLSRYCGRQPITRFGRPSRWPKWSRRCFTWPASPRDGHDTPKTALG
jgi:hypothetical protein